MKGDLSKQRLLRLFYFVRPAGVLHRAADSTDITPLGAIHCDPLLLGCRAAFFDVGLVQDTLGHMTGLASPVCQDLLAE